ncbi:fatty-acid amide hydrolase 2 [Cimex lectularius]|uniref:Amidase domain-containing protein n=1 Tax=Cimex lectularius TaxID=79782 RepID=A0A8I6TCS1_CIMLE|nr:fatty-acid amide hydrolase 2 [Cimex lectularius]XP_014244570.1 fatty-acid amide hydrolase 2 [Cimex lectularius]
MNLLCMKLLVFVRFLFEYFCDFLSSFIFNKNGRLEPIKKEFLSLSATKLAQRIRQKKLKSVELVAACIERVKEVNPDLNAVVQDRFELALKEAAEADAFIETSQLSEEELEKKKPFLGVPFTSKESTSCAGMRFTCGMLVRSNEIATEDADIVKHMKNSGAILIGVTNIPELNLWCETRNMIYGQSQNPYDFNRTCGGSSGGEAGIVSACGSPLGLATDIGGSTRMPAYYCGLFGHKPTSGFVSTKGMSFRTGTEGLTMVSAGSITKHSEDIIPFVKVLANDKADLLKLDEKVNLKEVRVYYILDPGDIRVSPMRKEVMDVILKSANFLSKITKEPAKPVKIEEFKYSSTLWRHSMTKEKSNFAFDLSNRERQVFFTEEIFKMCLGKCNYTLPALMKLAQEQVLPPVDEIWGDVMLKKLTQQLEDLLKDDGVLLFPNCPTTAPYHYMSFLRPYNFGYWGVFNALHLPATTAPLGLSSDKLPLGVQIVANAKNDRLTIAVAQALEKEFGGWVPPFDV